MSKSVRRLLTLDDLSTSDVLTLFNKSKSIKTRIKDSSGITSPRFSALGLFFEPSTRTRVSFELAVKKLSGDYINFDSSGSSLVKGESLKATFGNLSSLAFDVVIVRSGENPEFLETLQETELPIVNAGYSHKSHPTQALLDAFTVLEELKKLQEIHWLFVGDVLHSRVFASHLKLSQLLGYKLGVCAPEFLRPDSLPKDVKFFAKLEEGLEWAQVCEGLRVQFERHSNITMSKEDYFNDFGLNEKNIQAFSDEGVLLHPGPYNNGVDFDEKLMNDRRVKIHNQVSNGLFVRMAVLASLVQS